MVPTIYAALSDDNEDDGNKVEFHQLTVRNKPTT